MLAQYCTCKYTNTCSLQVHNGPKISLQHRKISAHFFKFWFSYLLNMHSIIWYLVFFNRIIDGLYFVINKLNYMVVKYRIKEYEKVMQSKNQLVMSLRSYVSGCFSETRRNRVIKRAHQSYGGRTPLLLDPMPQFLSVGCTLHKYSVMHTVREY